MTRWRSTALVAVITLTGCGIIPGTGPDDAPIHPQMARAGLDVGILVPAWADPNTEGYLCASRLSDIEMRNLAAGEPRLHCLSLEAEHNGFEWRGFYSFGSASAWRRSAFDEARDWFLILTWNGPPSGRVQVVVPGGPVEVRP